MADNRYNDQVPVDSCLQCQKTREEVKQKYNWPCATATYGEVVEGLDDWNKHHWRDWSNAELDRFGVHESLRDKVRRYDIYNIWEFAVGESACIRRGHHMPIEDWPEVCGCCWQRLDGKEHDND